MIVFRLSLFILAGLLGAMTAAGARAQECAPNAILDAYRQGEAAYQRKDFAAALARLKPLAEQGLGPAQLRVGQMLAEDTAKPDLVEAYRWTALAADAGASGAGAALDAVKARLTPMQIAQAGVNPASWQPANLWPCLAVDPRTKRPDGTTGYDAARLVNHVEIAKTATGAPAQRLAWLAANLEAIRTKSPRYLIYFRALHGILFVGGPGQMVSAQQREGLPLLVVNEAYTDKPALETLQQLVAAAIYGVGVALVPPVVATDVETYKGFTIRTDKSERGQRFLALIKAGIDMLAQLPPDLAAQARSTTDVRFEPSKPFDSRGGAISGMVFRRDPQTGAGYLSYTETALTGAAAHAVLGMVDSAVFQRRLKQREEAEHALEAARKRNDAAAVAKAEQRIAQLKKDHDSLKGDCELEDLEIKTMEALKLSPTEIEGAYKRRIRRGCA